MFFPLKPQMASHSLQAKVQTPVKPSNISSFAALLPYLLLITLFFLCFVLHPHQTTYTSFNSLCGFKAPHLGCCSLCFKCLSSFESSSQTDLSLKLFVITMPLPQIELSFSSFIFPMRPGQAIPWPLC